MIKGLVTVSTVAYRSSNPGVRPIDSYRIDWYTEYIDDSAATTTSWSVTHGSTGSGFSIVRLDFPFDRILAQIKLDAAANLSGLVTIDPADIIVLGLSWQ